MTKEISANLLTEIESGAPIIATCWRIERTDGVIFGFTDWPDEFTYDGLLYKSSGGYQRTAIDQKEGLNVDNMDVVGIIDDDSITEEDLLAGIYKGAQVQIFLVSPRDLSWGDLKLDYGYIGEITVQKTNFTAEFRSLTTMLSQEFGDKYSRYCRWELGDSNCGVIFTTSTWQENTAYSLNDLVEPTTLNSYRYRCTNPGVSNTEIVEYIDAVDSNGGPLNHWRLGESSGPTAVDRKGIINLTAVNSPTFSTTGLITNDADTCIDFNAASSQYLNLAAASAVSIENFFHTLASVEVVLNLDGSGVIVSKDQASTQTDTDTRGWAIHYDSSDQSITFYQRFRHLSLAVSDGSWTTATNSVLTGTTYHIVIVYDGSTRLNVPIIYINGSAATIASSTTPLDLHLVAPDDACDFNIGRRDPNGGSTPLYIDGRIDEVALYDFGLTAEEVSIRYGASIDDITPAEPVWPTTVGNTVSEASGLEWTTEKALKQAGEVTVVTSDYSFQTDITGYAAEWFTYGVLTWVTGNNSGYTNDIKQSQVTNGQMILRQKPPYPISVGDTFTVTAGCNHILKMPGDVKGSPYTGDCRVKFNNVINYGGEPELPNIDRIAAPADKAT